MLKEALLPFCDDSELRPTMAKPFRQKDSDGRDCIVASNGHILIRIRAKEAGVAVGGFTPQEKPNVNNVIPAVGFDRLLSARTVCREDMTRLLADMKHHEETERQVAAADVQGVLLSINGLSHIERAMAFCGADMARLVWAEGSVVMLHLLGSCGREAVTILHMCFNPEDCRRFPLPTQDDCDGSLTTIDWQRGAAAWAEAKQRLEREREAERMARREVYMVEVVKRAYIPVYAKDADEARRLVTGNWIDPEDNGDDEWMLGDTVPEAEDVDDLDDCYESILTRDGTVTRDEIYELEQISEQWHKEHRE